jgi:hypothetical protein
MAPTFDVRWTGWYVNLVRPLSPDHLSLSPPTRPRAPPIPEYYCPHTPTPEPHGRSQNPPTTVGTVGTVGTPTGHPAGESGGDTRRTREGAQETHPVRWRWCGGRPAGVAGPR